MFSSPHRLHQHKQHGHAASTFECRIKGCTYACVAKDNLTRHMHIDHADVLSGQLPGAKPVPRGRGRGRGSKGSGTEPGPRPAQYVPERPGMGYQQPEGNPVSKQEKAESYKTFQKPKTPPRTPSRCSRSPSSHQKAVKRAKASLTPSQPRVCQLDPQPSTT